MKSAWFLLLAVPVVACSSTTVHNPTLDSNGNDAATNGDDTESDASTSGLNTDASIIADGGGVIVKGDDDAGDDGGDAGPVSPGLPDTDTTYPALTPDMPSLQRGASGAILTRPKIVSVIWKDDPLAASFEDFATKLPVSTYWTTTMAEWGVGTTTNTNYVVQTAVPTSLDDQGLENLVTSGVNGGGWPAADAQTVYMMYIPASVNLTTTDDSGNVVNACTQYAGYHTETNYDDTSANAQHLAWGVIAVGCNDPTQPSALASATETAAHEVAEAVTDPLPDIKDGLEFFDTSHFAWELYNDGQDEVADACEFYASSYYEEGADLPYYVSKLWSNSSAAAGHNPCVPAVTGQPYYNISDTSPQSINVTDSDGVKHATTGYRIAVGSSFAIPFTFYSDGEVPGGWFLEAVEGDGQSTPDGDLTVHLDTTQGNNGTTGTVTVTVTKNTGKATAHIITLTSRHGGFLPHYMPILIGGY